MCIKQRVSAYCEYKNIAISRFEKEAGLSNGYFNQVKKRPSLDKIESISRAFPDFSTSWLLTGEGSMLKSDNIPTLPTEEETQYTTLLLPVAARGGTLVGFSQAVKEYECESIPSPISKVDFAMPVYGESMSPEYPNGSIIFLKKINERLFIEWGKVFVMDTENGPVIKKLMPTDDPNIVECVSLNPDFPPFRVCLDGVLGIYRILSVIINK